MPCTSCLAANPAPARFCMSCGVALGSAAGRTVLAGQRKQVTVLFAGLVGSTELIEALDPEEAQALLDDAVRVMMGAVHRYGGTVTQTRGDSIVALFGAPVAHEDHAVRACYAAFAMQEAFRRDGPRRWQGQPVPVQLRAGLNSGEVVVRSIASDVGLEYTAMGQAVHLAARIEQAARPGTVLLGSATRALADGYVRVRELGPMLVKGLPEPVTVCELLEIGPARRRLDVVAARGLTAS